MTDSLLDHILPKDGVAALVQQLADSLKAHTRPCPDCGGRPWGDDERVRFCVICETLYHDDEGEQELLALQQKIRDMHA